MDVSVCMDVVVCGLCVLCATVSRTCNLDDDDDDDDDEKKKGKERRKNTHEVFPLFRSWRVLMARATSSLTALRRARAARRGSVWSCHRCGP